VHIFLVAEVFADFAGAAFLFFAGKELAAGVAFDEF
jgi:hypothetical protein